MGLVILLTAGAIASAACGAIVVSLYWLDRLDTAWQAGHAEGLADGAALGECRGHVRTLPRPYDHARER